MAAKAYPYYRLIIGGTMDRGNSWSVGLSVVNHAAATAGAIQAWLDGIAPDVSSSWSSSGSGWGGLASPGTKLQSLRGYHYAAGSSSADLTAEHLYAGVAGYAAGAASPTMLSCVVSLLTGAAGRHNRGRSYVPADGAALANHQFVEAAIDAVGAGFRDLIDHVNGSTLGGEDCTVVIGAQLPAPPEVTRVRVDSVPDTQRPRATGAPSLFLYSDDV